MNLFPHDYWSSKILLQRLMGLCFPVLVKFLHFHACATVCSSMLHHAATNCSVTKKNLRICRSMMPWASVPSFVLVRWEKVIFSSNLLNLRKLRKKRRNRQYSQFLLAKYRFQFSKRRKMMFFFDLHLVHS